MAATARFDRSRLEEVLKEALPEGFDASKEHEVHTERDEMKLVPCRECGRPLAVTVFFAPAKAVCKVCSPRSEGRREGPARVGVPQAGRTDPAKAENLLDCLVNEGFKHALCPAHPSDEDHVMELKQVSHSEHYGPGLWRGKAWQQTAPGESVTWQCTRCNATVNYSTMQVVQFRRQNEPRQKPDFGPPHRNVLLEVRGKDPTDPRKSA